MKKVSLIICLFIFLFSCSNGFNLDEDGKTLRKVCSGLPVLPNSEKRDEREVMKSTGGVVSMFFSHKSVCSSVIIYYDNALNKRGWKKVPKTFFSNPDEFNYERQGIEINLTCSYGRYTLSCSK